MLNSRPLKNVLIIIPYKSIYPILNGGMHRCFHILNQLAIHFDVTVITFQKEKELKKAVEDFPAIGKIKVVEVPFPSISDNFFSKRVHRVKWAVLQRWHSKKWRASADSTFIAYYPYLKQELQKKDFDIIILEKLATIKAVNIIRKNAKGAKILYNAHNFDTELTEEDVNNGKASTKLLKIVSESEGELYKTVNGILACSEIDAVKFREANKNRVSCYIVPNGILSKKESNGSIKNLSSSTILFCGTLDYPPNNDGLCWFLENCWTDIKKNIPYAEFVIIGSGRIGPELKKTSNADGVKLIGQVIDTTIYYNQAAIAIVPIHQGSGTRLKVLEAMEQNVPIVSTEKGAEGIDYTNEKNILIANDACKFTASIIELLKDAAKRKFISKNAFELVTKKYSWDHIGLSLKSILNSVE